MSDSVSDWRSLSERLRERVLEPMKKRFVGKDEVVDLLGVCLVAGENLFILGPPGTAKSALVNDLGRSLGGTTFEYLLTRFTEPNELFGPFDIRKLRDGELRTNTEGMLPEANLVFLDELLNANSAILNSLLMVLNERVFRRGKERWSLPTLMVVGASNHLPEDDALGALFDRFLLRVRCDNVADERLSDVLKAGWRHEVGIKESREPALSLGEVQRLQGQLLNVDFEAIQDDYPVLVKRLRYAGLSVSDRRAVKLQRLIAASAILCGRSQARLKDMWVLRYIWEAEEEQELLASILDERLSQVSSREDDHPRSSGLEDVDAEALARDFEDLSRRLQGGQLTRADEAYMRDRLTLLAARSEWVVKAESRSALQGLSGRVWSQFQSWQAQLSGSKS